MEEEILENYRKARSVSDNIMPYAKALIRENTLVLGIAEKIEEKIESLGAKPAFPVNISINENAAHYTPDIDDALILKQEDLVKIDFGVHVNGYIWDRAFTVCVGGDHPLIHASEKALQETLKIIKPGVRICEISEVVEDSIASFEFNPVRNLCGHGLERFNQHAKPAIPNGKNSIKEKIEEGQVIAMEVFATNGAGLVKESYPVLIYRYKQDKAVRLWEARKILEISKTEFQGLPFAKRWLKGISKAKIDIALRQLTETNAIEAYPILKEETNGLVAQSEETIIVK